MSRSYLNAVRIEQLGADLSPKELAVLSTLHQVRLASADQLERLHFVSDQPRNRRRVLQVMADRGLITRLDRTVGGHKAGSSGFVYALGVGGARLLLQGLDGRVRRPTTPGAPFVAHTLAVTELVVRLWEAERRGILEVLEVQTEPACWRRHPGPGGGLVTCKPDAYVRIGIGEFEDSYFLEVDRGTEHSAALQRQLDRYRRYWAAGVEQSWRGVFPKVLWLAPTQRRHQELVDACGRQPAESWRLHLVTMYDNAIATMAEGAA
jgi:hypothetical protein